MSPETLLRHFEQISEAPDAVPALRKFILDLAIREKLAQTGLDPSRDNLSGRLRAAKLAAVPEVPRQKVDAPITADELPIEGVPESRFVRLKEIAHIEKGNVGIQSATPGSYPLVGLSEARSNCSTFQFDGKAAIIPLISSTGHGHASMKRLHYQEGKFALANILCAALPYAPELISARFLYEYFSAYREQLLVAKMIGTANVSLTIEKIRSCPVPLVGPNQQRRMEELLILCDELETARQVREQRRDRLVAASLHALSNGNLANGTVTTFKESARFYFNHLPHLTTRPEHIKQLRETILSLAVSGKLVSASGEYGSANLLHDVDLERKRVAETDARADEEPQELLWQELCWDVPPSWRWRGLADLVLFIDYRGQTPAKVTSGVRLITAKNVRPGRIRTDPEEFITDTTYEKWMTRGLPRVGDILFTTEAPMGNAAVIEITERFALAQRVICFHPYSSMNAQFIALELQSLSFQKVLGAAATGLTAKGIKAAKLKRLPIAVPPVAEQQQIVAKVSELMALCDELEAQLTKSAFRRCGFLEAALQEAVNSATGES